MSHDNNDLNDPKLAKTFPRLIRSAAVAYGDNTAIVHKTDHAEHALSFAELDRQSAELARGLIARGVNKGTRVGFIFGNGPSFALMFAAIARAGGVAIPVSTLIKHNELVRVLRQADLAGLIVQRELLGKDYVDRVIEALPELAESDSPELRLNQTPYLRWIASSGDNLPNSIRPMSWLYEGAESVGDDLLEQVEAEIHPSDQMLEIYTSGSMALPKGVKHNHGPIMFRAHWLRSMTPSSMLGREIIVPMPMPTSAAP